MFQTIGDRVKITSRAPNVHQYVPHIKQLAFHKSQAYTRLYIGGNRSGKTVGGIVEDIWWLTGTHPYRKTPEPPVMGRIVAPDRDRGLKQIIIPKLKQWLPPSALINGSWEDSFSNADMVLTLANGSTCDLLTFEQDLGAHGGTSRHFVHWDEEPPKHIYDEDSMRLIDTDGSSWLTLTPLNGMTWIYDTVYIPGLTGNHTSYDVIIVDIHENPHLTEEAIARVLDNLDEDERKAREKGQFVQLGGLVYKEFNSAVHVIPPVADDLLRNARIYRSMDHGFNNPTAWLWHAVFPDGTIITFDEHYKSEMIIKEHAQIVNLKTAAHKLPIFMTVGDPAIQQRNAVEGLSIAQEYAKYGIFIAEGNNDVLTGVNKIASYLKINPKTGKPYWQITENCVDLIREMGRLRWKSYASRKAQFDNNPMQQIQKKDDHAADSARYFFSFMDDLTPEVPAAFVNPHRNTATESYDQVLVRMSMERDSGIPDTDWRIGTNPIEWDW